jgi:hypothetical protein
MQWGTDKMWICALAAQKGIVTTTRHRIVGAGRRSKINPEVEDEILQWFDIKRRILKVLNVD